MIVTVVPHGGVNPAVEYGFEEAVDGSVALNPSEFLEPAADLSLHDYLGVSWLRHLLPPYGCFIGSSLLGPSRLRRLLGLWRLWEETELVGRYGLFGVPLSSDLYPCGLKFFEGPEAFGYDLFLAGVSEALSASQSTRIYLII